MNGFDWSVIRDRAFLRQLKGRIPHGPDRDDAIQDACVKLLRNGVFVTQGLFFTTTVNCHKDHVKGENRRKAREQSRMNPEHNPSKHRRVGGVTLTSSPA